MNLAEIAASTLDASSKGIPGPVTPATAARMNWNLLKDDLPYPVMVLLDSVVEHNLRTMAAWCAKNSFAFAPHGKTTMCPQLAKRQIDSGAWGITAATAQQAEVYAGSGVQRIIIANQLVGRANVQTVSALLKAGSAREIHCFLDSVDGVRHLAGHLRESGAGRTLGALVEGGREGWRTGARSMDEARAVLAEILRHPQVLEFTGFSGYEGIARLEDGVQVKEYLDGLLRTADLLAREAPARPEPFLFTVGGTSFLDYQHEVLPAFAKRFRLIVRSGCYVTHDHGHYPKQMQRARSRGMGEEGWPPFRAALELWSMVQSVRDGSTAMLTFGKRDCSYDMDLPVPLVVVRPGQTRREGRPLEGAKIVKLNDQHAYMALPPGADVRVGDRVACGIIHPCTAFDKWPVIPLVDDGDRVIDLYRTFF